MSKSEIRDRKMPLSQKNYRDYNFSTAKVFFPSSTGEKEGFVQSASSDATSMDVLVPEGVGKSRSRAVRRGFD